MEQVRVFVEYRDDLPAGLPAVWEERCAAPRERAITLYLRNGLSQEMADCFRVKAVRSALPEASFDAFTVAPVAARIAAVA